MQPSAAVIRHVGKRTGKKIPALKALSVTTTGFEDVDIYIYSNETTPALLMNLTVTGFSVITI